MVIEFEVLDKDKVLSEVRINEDLSIEVNQFYEHPMLRPVPDNPTVKELNEFLESRCVPRTRGNIKELLKGIGLTSYEPLDIVRHTHGVMFEDFIWIRFKGENLTFGDIKMRD